ncbi:hypothetical protein [Prevotella intermedia]|nr:hypothetical protein [Prevotella intermedia]
MVFLFFIKQLIHWGVIHHVPNTEYCKLTATEKGAKWVLGTW